MAVEEDKCPVDHKAREAWMIQKEQEELASRNGGEAAACPVDHTARAAWTKKAPAGAACSSERMDSTVSPGQGPIDPSTGLSTEREVSSIPRAGSMQNWVYPSQKQFFDAMKRKNFDPDARDMQSIIPIHNAVNERAWMEILKWEEGRGGEQCGGPKLVKFQGDSSKLTPTARWNVMWGLQKPFDRHDWTIERCGKEVDYVIDFYTGKPNPLMPDMPSFYLDARPKLNSLEGFRLRISKFFGF
ncbi:holocytochrome-c1 synthase [Trichomonascus vanleenenianus]|uniref:cytochrome c1 heme lyase CYT2 n=1 Tax=Trichomonascus vanleenenianus TaxID=2268995 RepID=UPI003EC9BA80